LERSRASRLGLRVQSRTIPGSSEARSDTGVSAHGAPSTHWLTTLGKRPNAPVGLLAVVVIVNVAVGIWWIGRWRVGWPFDIDEAGYLQMALADGVKIDSGLPGSIVSIIHTSNPQAPLLPAFAGLVEAATHLSAAWLIASLQIFLVMAAGATYLCARRCMSGWWAFVAASLVAVAPGLVWASRSFYFALPAGALFMAAIVAELWAGHFDSIARSIVWGMLMGLAALTRSMVLGLLPGLVLAAELRVLVGPSRNRRKAFVNCLIGIGTALLVAGSWYSDSWRNVLDYLTQYGYGSKAAEYGSQHSVLSWSWWTFRLDNIVQSDLFLPITIALALPISVGLVMVIWRVLRYKRVGIGLGLISKVQLFVAGDLGTMIVVFLWGYLILSSTRNVGSGFEVPLVPVGVVLCVSVAARLPRVARVASSVCMLGAAVVAFADQATLLPGGVYDTTTVSIGSLSVPVFDARGVLLSYASAFLTRSCPGLVVCSPRLNGAGRASLKAWVAASKRMATLVETDAARHERPAVVFFAMQDPFVNTNTVGLYAQEKYGASLAVGLLRPPVEVHMSFAEQLNDPLLGQPDLVVTGPPARTAGARAFSPLPNDRSAIVALRRDGFIPDGSVMLPDGRKMVVWWRESA